MEIEIKIPYGHLAAKWWGRRDVRPILCIHGWLDNAASFDSLIPLLPDHVGYLAIDMPGCGFSSHLPNGLMYSTIEDIYIINYIVRQFGWSTVSLIAHSMGAMSCFIYAATFPGMVDMLVALDSLQPFVISPPRLSFLMSSIEQVRICDVRNIVDDDMPSHTFEELFEKMHQQTFVSLTRSSARLLLARTVKESAKEKGRFIVMRDSRLKYLHASMYTPEINDDLAASVECPLLFVRALQSSVYIPSDEAERVLDVMKEKTNFEMITVDGVHHVHLNEPTLVSDAVSEFVCKYLPVGDNCIVVNSKL